MTEARDARIAELTAILDDVAKQVADLWKKSKPFREERAMLKAAAKKDAVALKKADRKAIKPYRHEVREMFKTMSIDEQAVWLLAHGKSPSNYYRMQIHQKTIDALEECINEIARNGHPDPKVYAGALLYVSVLPETVDLRVFDQETATRIVNRYRLWGYKINMQEAA